MASGIFKNGSFRSLSWEQARPQVNWAAKKIILLLAKGCTNAAAFYGSVLTHEGAHGLALAAIFGDFSPQISINWRGQALIISSVREGIYQEISGELVPTYSSALVAMTGPFFESFYYGMMIYAVFFQRYYPSHPGIHQWRIFSLDWTGVGLALSTIHSLSYGITMYQESLGNDPHYLGNDFEVVQNGAGPAASALVATIYCTSAFILLCLSIHSIFSSAIRTPCRLEIWV